MVMQNLVSGIFFGVIGQVLSFFQLQAGIRFGWTEKWSWALMLLGFPISWSFMKSVQYFINAFDGQIYPSRILGFAVGIIVFSTMGWFLFREGITPKTGVCLLLSLCIILIQILWK
jgi:multidrug transporter EmrE-like cation transporter